jgi:hypothetical protein
MSRRNALEGVLHLAVSLRMSSCRPSMGGIVATTSQASVPRAFTTVASPLYAHKESRLCHTRFLCQNQVLMVCMTQDQLFHTYGPKVFTDNHMSQIKYNYYIINVSKDYDDSQ